MKNIKITPVLLCGGSGTRLWPLSRKSYPKQFAPLVGEQTLFEISAQRLSGERFNAPLVLTNSDFRFIVTEQLAAAGVDPGAILIEPESRNTGPAVLAAALYLYNQDPDALMLVAPSDHVIPDTKAFQAAIFTGVDAAQAGRLVTFGITPTRAETGYGYLKLGRAPVQGQVTRLEHFVEKPNARQADEMLGAGTYLWNAGIFLFSAKSIISAFKTHAPDLIMPIQKAVTHAVTDLGFLRLDAGAWTKAESISIDYAVMERADNLSVVPFGAGWSDLGGWDAVWQAGTPDANGVVTRGPATAIDCHNSIIRSESDTQEVVAIGLKNTIVITMPDAVLVADMTRAQDVKKVVRLLIGKGAQQATAFPKDHRPWGWFETLVLGEQFQVKRIMVHPGASLSLQSHVHRSEHWVVVAGTAKVTVDNRVFALAENQSAYIPLGAVHRVENPGCDPLMLIEVQAGSYLGEDDIVRYEDAYARA